MGWYTNYEVEFTDTIDWDDADVTRSLSDFAVQYLYLRDMAILPRVMLSIYSQDHIFDVLDVLKSLYSTSMRYRVYNSGDEWIAFA